MNLQNMCRIAILQNFSTETLTDLPLPVKLIMYLHYKPEFNWVLYAGCRRYKCVQDYTVYIVSFVIIKQKCAQL